MKLSSKENEMRLPSMTKKSSKAKSLVRQTEGARLEKLQIAKQLLAQGVSIDVIHTSTGLHPEEIDALAEILN